MCVVACCCKVLSLDVLLVFGLCCGVAFVVLLFGVVFLCVV